jgi:hypothetical protein
MKLLYPGSTPEFRIFKKLDGTQVLQVRYVNETQKYVSRWQDIPIIEEEVLNGN